MRIFGIDQGSPDGDNTAVSIVNNNAVYVATLPDQFGRVVSIKERHGKVVVTSETGDTMIIPIPSPRSPSSQTDA